MPRNRLTDEALNKDMSPLLFEQAFTRQPPETANLAANPDADTITTTADTLATTVCSVTTAPLLLGPAPTRASGAELSAASPQLLLSWMESKEKGRSDSDSVKGVHLYIFVHGFHGNAFGALPRAFPCHASEHQWRRNYTIALAVVVRPTDLGPCSHLAGAAKTYEACAIRWRCCCPIRPRRAT